MKCCMKYAHTKKSVASHFYRQQQGGISPVAKDLIIPYTRDRSQNPMTANRLLNPCATSPSRTCLLSRFQHARPVRFAFWQLSTRRGIQFLMRRPRVSMRGSFLLRGVRVSRMTKIDCCLGRKQGTMSNGRKLLVKSSQYQCL